MAKARFFSAYDYPEVYKPSEPRFDPGSDEVASQEFKDNLDPNSIMKRFATDGVAPIYRTGDLIDVNVDDLNASDFESALNIIADAKESFEALPSEIRERFGNNPAKFLRSMEDPRFLEESYTLGLRERPAPVAPVVPVDPGPKGGQPPVPPAGQGPNT